MTTRNASNASDQQHSNQEESQVPLPPPHMASSEYIELNSKYLSVLNQVNKIQSRIDRSVSPARLFAIGGGVVLGVAAISIVTTAVVKKLFPGMPEERPRATRTQSA